MTTASVQRTSLLALISATLVCTPAAFASIVYDNSSTVTDLSTYIGAQNGVELGDEIVLAGTDRTITDFRFEYFLSANASGNEQAQLTFRLNDGTALIPLSSGRKLPNTQFFQISTDSVSGLETGRSTVVANGISATLPLGIKNFTWSVNFTGIEAGEEVGLVLNSPPTIGSSPSDYWQLDNGVWTTGQVDGGAVQGSFAARVTAVPEPSSLALGAFGALAFLSYLSRKRSI
ncbi:MAG: PEP-CTERM sorting domain-containing protein [Pedosphaera sp.]|nr:PEP-CTERM sorting domain-containing protein [Pedosphaera sp.]